MSQREAKRPSASETPACQPKKKTRRVRGVRCEACRERWSIGKAADTVHVYGCVRWLDGKAVDAGHGFGMVVVTATMTTQNRRKDAAHTTVLDKIGAANQKL